MLFIGAFPGLPADSAPKKIDGYRNGGDDIDIVSKEMSGINCNSSQGDKHAQVHQGFAPVKADLRGNNRAGLFLSELVIPPPKPKIGCEAESGDCQPQGNITPGDKGVNSGQSEPQNHQPGTGQGGSHAKVCNFLQSRLCSWAQFPAANTLAKDQPGN